MHGRLLAGLAAWAIDRDHGDPAFVPARLTVDLFKSPAMKETQVSTILVRAGGRVRVADALIQVGGVDVARASALYLRKGDAPVDDAPLTPAWDSIVPGLAASPSSRRRSRSARSTEWDSAPPGPDAPGCASFGLWSPARRSHPSFGPRSSPTSRARSRTRRPRASSTSTPMPRSTSRGCREGEWIGVEYADRVAADGVSVAHCRLYDEHGPIGSSEVCAVLTPRMPAVRARAVEPSTSSEAGAATCRPTRGARRLDSGR